jgi:hypothetical protein
LINFSLENISTSFDFVIEVDALLGFSGELKTLGCSILGSSAGGITFFFGAAGNLAGGIGLNFGPNSA